MVDRWVAHVTDVSRIMGVSGGIGVVEWEATIDLSQSVGLGLSITLSVIVTMADTGDDSDVMGMTCSIGVVNGETSVDLSKGVGISIGVSLAIVTQTRVSMDSMADMSDHTWVVKTTVQCSVDKGNSSSNLSNGPRFSLTFSKMMNTNAMESRVDDSSVSNGSNSRHDTIAVVNTSDETTMSVSRGHLTNGVWVTADSCSKGKNLSNKLKRLIMKKLGLKLCG